MYVHIFTYIRSLVQTVMAQTPFIYSKRTKRQKGQKIFVHCYCSFSVGVLLYFFCIEMIALWKI